jgi:hypothetical protein
MQLLLAGYVSGTQRFSNVTWSAPTDIQTIHPMVTQRTPAEPLGVGNALAFFIVVHGITIWTDDVSLMVRQ